MVSFTDLKTALPERFRDAATAYETLSGVMDDQLDPLRTNGTKLADAWSGDDQVGGTTAVTAVRDQYDRASIAQADLASVATELNTLADAVELAKGQLEDALEQAKGFAIVAADGSSIKLDMEALQAKGVDPSDIKHYMTAMRGIADSISDAVSTATEADETAKARIAVLTPTLTGTPPAVADVPEPDPDWNPEQVNDWWQGLTAEQRQSLLMHRPDLIGPLDGIPTVYRDVANRTLLQDQLADVEAALKNDPEDKRLLGIREGLLEIQDRLDRDSGNAGYDDRAYLLLIDSEGDGQAVVAVGNPDEADNVVTLVPGTGADLSNASGDVGRIDRMVSDANLRDPDSSTAGIMWLGYDAPDNVAMAALPSYANNAEDALQRFQWGMEVVQGGPDQVLNTTMGHSYGSTVVGHSAEAGDGLRTDQIVFVGSPGVGTDHASNLQIGAENVYATTAPNDLIHIVPDAPWAHNTAPIMESFGAEVFETPRHDGSRAEAHSAYWDDGNPARDAFSQIITGNGDDVPRTDYHERWYQWRPWG
ncbi:alpha/beta hydrolase family protein [Stackebrandtia endophytica]|uniref:Alpha/beta hydrolase family protein n=1 Tax=Stackebrandtia endophytica TaxID=1496996 RepID=A0A543AVM4_9ACTN|nr:alpha/beta hydrolase [Stackebrandtia endophytica]TQL76591.1 alpha/beta hydrolase family protein [Stackebrandtia endophytica]